MDRWDKCEFAVSEGNLEGRICYGGLDLSPTTDITAFVLVFPPEDETDKTSSYRISGYRRTTLNCESGVTMCHTMCGSDKGIYKLPKAMPFTTATLKVHREPWGTL